VAVMLIDNELVIEGSAETEAVRVILLVGVTVRVGVLV